MKYIKVLAIASLVTLAACTTVKDFFRNVTAADCATPAAQQAFVNNLPGIALIPPAQMDNAVAQVCIGLFGTVSAPTPAPGMSPALPAPSASVVSSPAASSSASPVASH